MVLNNLRFTSLELEHLTSLSHEEIMNLLEVTYNAYVNITDDNKPIMKNKKIMKDGIAIDEYYEIDLHLLLLLNWVLAMEDITNVADYLKNAIELFYKKDAIFTYCSIRERLNYVKCYNKGGL